MKEEVKKVAKNARLKLDKDETEEMADDFEDILEMFETLDDINTDDVEASFHPVETESRTREDVKNESLAQKETFQNTENEEEGFFKGPSA